MSAVTSSVAPTSACSTTSSSTSTTAVAYERDWAYFIAYCAERGRAERGRPYPAEAARPQALADYLGELVARGCKPSTVRRQASSIAAAMRKRAKSPDVWGPPRRLPDEVRAVLRTLSDG